MLEVGVVVGVVEDLTARPVIGEFLQRQGSPGNVLSEGLPGFVIAPMKTHGVVHREP